MIGITGGKGILGKILASQYKERNIEVSIFDGDITNFDQIKNWLSTHSISKIIHLASKVAVKDVQSNLANAYDVNVSGTINLLKALSQLDKDVYFFYASSSHIYKSSELPLTENDVIAPINSYGLTKYMSELLLNDYKNNNSNFHLCIGRIFSFYHDTQKPPFLYPSLLERFQNEDLEKPFQLYGALSTRDFLNAEQVCEIIVKLIEKKYQGTVNIASGTSTKIIDFVQKIAPQKLFFQYDLSEKQNHLNADISLLNSILKHE